MNRTLLCLIALIPLIPFTAFSPSPAPAQTPAPAQQTPAQTPAQAQSQPQSTPQDPWPPFAATRPASNIDPPPPVIPNQTFNLKDYGAVGDSKTWNTAAFAKAISAVQQAGGGQLIVPAGTYLTLPITLTSRLDLHLDPGSTILFPTDLTAYGLPDPAAASQDQIDAAAAKIPLSLIFGDHLTDVAVTGSGTIDGGGALWWKYSDKLSKNIPGQVHYDRPKLLILQNSRRLLIQGVTFTASPMWNVVPTLCQDVRVENIKTSEPEFSPNTDGVNPVACQNVLIRNCRLDDGDDCIAVKAIGGPCENILIENLTCLHGHGISIGSETYGGIHNVFVRHCTFNGTKIGIRIKSARDRGNQLFAFTFDDIQMHNVATAIDIDLYYHDKKGQTAPQPITPTTPLLTDVQIHDVTATDIDRAGRIIGLPEQLIRDITLTNVQITSNTGLTIQDAKDITLTNTKITPAEGDPITLKNAQIINSP
jgi:polygalacturonase